MHRNIHQKVFHDTNVLKNCENNKDSWSFIQIRKFSWTSRKCSDTAFLGKIKRDEKLFPDLDIAVGRDLSL